jgi:uncharacterized protein (TIGR03437 family)
MKMIGIAFVLVVLSFTAVVQAQQYTISTFAGGGQLPTAGPAIGVAIGTPAGIATDSDGNVYFANSSQNRVFRVNTSGTLTLIAGDARAGYSGDGGPATAAQLSGPTAVALDGAGKLYIADAGNYRIRKVLANGTIVTVAGSGTLGFSGDGGAATDAQFGNVYNTGPSGGLALDGAGNLFIGDVGNNRIRKVSTSGIITTVAGDGTQGFSGDGGPAIHAQLLLGDCCAVGLAADSAGNLFIADDGNGRIRKVSTDGIITTVAGNGMFGIANNTAAINAPLSFPIGIAVDGTGDLFIVSYGTVQKVSPNGILTTVAGNGVCCGFSGDGGPATNAQVNASAVAVDRGGNLFIADSGNQRIRKVSTDGIINTVAGHDIQGNASGDGGPATSARFAQPGAAAVDNAGNIYIADNDRVRKVSPTGMITTVAGGGTGGLGDGGPAISATLDLVDCNWLCSGMALDHAGNLYLADVKNGRVRKVSPAGIITTVAGGGQDMTDNEGPALGAALIPTSIAIDVAGNLFIAGYLPGNDDGTRVRKVSPDGNITTIAGGGSASPLNGGVATSVELLDVGGIAVDGSGNLFLTHPSYQRIHKISPNGMITTVAGGGSSGSGDDGPAINAQLSYYVWGIAVDQSGNLLFTDYNRVRKISPDGIIHTIGGNGQYGYYSVDGAAAASAALGFLPNIAVDMTGNVYSSDWYNKVVHILRPSAETVLITSVVDAASERQEPLSPGKIVVIYGAGLGPVGLVQNQASNGQFSTEVAGTKVFVNGVAAPVLYTSSMQVAVIVPYRISGTVAQVSAMYQGQTSDTFAVPVALSAPNIFTTSQTGAGQAAAFNVAENTVNTATNPVKVGEYISFYATGEGQTAPAGADGQVGGSTATHPLLPVSVTVGGIPAAIQFKGGVQGQVAGLMQINVQIPTGVRPGGFVPIVLKVGDASSGDGVWIAVAEN